MKKLSILILMIFVSFGLLACTNESVDLPSYEHRFSFDNYMNTLISIRVLDDDETIANTVQHDVEQIYAMYHALTTNYEALDASSTYLANIYELNQSIGTRVEIDQPLYELLSYAEDIKELTDGYFDISIGKVVDAWKGIIVEEPEPLVGDTVFLTDEEVYVQITAINNQTGEISVSNHTETFTPWDFKQDITQSAFELTVSHANAVDLSNTSITLEEVAGAYYATLQGEDIKIDLGAISKGYATQKVFEYLDDQGIEHFSISAGTSSIVVGKNEKRDGDFYWISLANPIVATTTSSSYGTIYAKNTSVTTSGNYEQYVVYQGLRYHHIVSPMTKQPAHYYHTVTLIGENAGLLDALSTALFSMSPETLSSWLNSHQETLHLNVITYNQDRTISKYLLDDLNEDF